MSSKVSVIIPAYNSARYLPEAIDSILNQTYQNLEIVVVDDSSIDSTKMIIESYIVKYPDKFRYFYQPHNGVSAARNKGIIESQGAYLAFLDSDDIWLPDKLECQIKIIEANPDSAMICTDAEMFEQTYLLRASMCRSNYPQKKGTIKWQILQSEINDCSIIKINSFHDLLFGNIIVTSSVLIKREKLNSIGLFNPDLLVAEDYDLWLKVSENFPILYLNKTTTRYRYREDGLSSKKGLRESKYNEFNAKVHEKIMNRHPQLKNDLKEQICQEYRSASWGYLRNFNLKKAREMALCSICYYKLQPKLYLYVLISLLSVKIVNFIIKLKDTLKKL